MIRLSVFITVSWARRILFRPVSWLIASQMRCTRTRNGCIKLSQKIKAVVDIEAGYFDFAHLYELFDERPASGYGYVLCSIAVTEYSLGDPSFVEIKFDTPKKGWVKLYVPREHVSLIEEAERFLEKPPEGIGYKLKAKEEAA
jgi:hypothetical protein